MAIGASFAPRGTFPRSFFRALERSYRVRKGGWAFQSFHAVLQEHDHMIVFLFAAAARAMIYPKHAHWPTWALPHTALALPMPPQDTYGQGAQPEAWRARAAGTFVL